jgi:two-component system response regulator AtoC
MKKLILIVDDEAKIRRTIEICCEKMGHDSLKAESGEEALKILSRKKVDLVLADLKMPGMSGIDLLVEMRHRGQMTPVVIMTGHGTVDSAVEAMKQGASDFVLKPLGFDSIEMVISRVFEIESVRKEVVLLREELKEQRKFDLIIGESKKMQEIYSVIDRVAPTDASVLLYGETGTGKELLARLIHDKSRRRDRLFVAVNCAAIPATLLESELFGHVKGAYTGAEVERTGRFEKADGGSIFFDEIGDMDPVLQSKILRVLQEKEFEKVGSIETIGVNVRVIAATNRDLRKMIEENKFREDLYYRLNVVNILVPPLRDRSEDIPLLVEHFTRSYSREWGKEVAPPSDDEVFKVMKAYPWPGNVREMQNVIERAVALNSSGVIGLEDLPAEIVGSKAGKPEPLSVTEGKAHIGLEEAVTSLEKEMIERALRESDGIKAKAAKLLGVSERNLWYKLKKYGIG